MMLHVFLSRNVALVMRYSTHMDIHTVSLVFVVLGYIYSTGGIVVDKQNQDLVHFLLIMGQISLRIV